MEKLTLATKAKNSLEKLSTLELNTQKISPAQDYLDNTMIYGYLDPISKLWMFITGDHQLKRSVLDEGEARKQFKFGNLRKSVPIQELTPDIMKKCFESRTIANSKILIDELTIYIAQFVYLDNSKQYRLLRIMGTYHFMGFTYFPYLWLNAEKGSGKSTLLNLLSKLSFNGHILTFNN